MQTLLDGVVFLFVALVLPLLINKTTESGYLDWIKPWLRETWTGVFVLLSLYLLWREPVVDFTMFLHKQQNVPQVFIYVVFAIFGAGLFSGYYWLTGRLFDSSPLESLPKAAPQVGPKPVPPRVLRKEAPRQETAELKEQTEAVPKSENFKIQINRISRFEQNQENPRRYLDVYLDIEIVNSGPSPSVIYEWRTILKDRGRQASASISRAEEDREGKWNLVNYTDRILQGDRVAGWIKIVVFGPDVQPNLTLGISFQDAFGNRYSDEVENVDPKRAWARR